MKINKISAKQVITILFVLVSTLLFSSFVQAQWSGGGMEMKVETGTISLSSNSVINFSATGGNVYGFYSSVLQSGRFFNMTKASAVSTYPVVNLVYPVQNETLFNKDLIFEYDVSDFNAIDACSIYLDGVLKKSNVTPSRLTTNEFYLSNIQDGSHTWKVSCMNVNYKSNFSLTKTFNVIDLSNYSGSSTTDNSEVVNNSVSNLTLEVSDLGKIVFEGPTNISDLINIGKNVLIANKTIHVNSSAMPALNKPATLEMYNIEFNHVLLWKDGVVCSDCNVVSYQSGILRFEVDGFSTYVATSTSALSIFDDTDTMTRLVNESITFYANYSNITSGDSLSGNCEITFDEGGWTAPETMNFNASSKLYEYARSFENVQNYPFEVSCTTLMPGFDDLVAQDYVGISPVPTVTQSFVDINITVKNSSRYDLNHTGESNAQTLATGSNVSQVSLVTTMITDSWQGFYGTIDAEVFLKDANNNLFYSWNSSIKRGQIFASRSESVNWNTINCTSAEGISLENTYLNKSVGDPDSVTNTFSSTNHPHFVVGSNLLQNCASTQTNVYGGGKSDELWNILLSDNNGEGNILYTGIVNASSLAFNNELTDFQVLVGENGRTGAEASTPYYFFLELD